MYTFTNFKSKKALKEAVEAWNKRKELVAAGPMSVGAVLASKTPAPQPVRIFQPNDIFNNPKAASDYTGEAAVEGPHYPKPHSWYATVTVENGIVTKVK